MLELHLYLTVRELELRRQAMTVEPGDQVEKAFGRYQLLGLLGRGGMGEVWRAHDSVTDRVVAIKTLPAQFSDDEMFQQRFRREAQSAARLNSPHVIPIYDYGEIEGRRRVPMQYEVPHVTSLHLGIRRARDDGEVPARLRRNEEVVDMLNDESEHADGGKYWPHVHSATKAS